jgi:hypothetical protein
MTGYIVNNVEYGFHSAAVAAAKAIRANVVDAKSGRVVWTPPAPVSNARMVRYAHRKAAYEAQCRAGAR